MKKLLIAFEGLPGVGKTSLAKEMAEYFGGEFMEEVVANDKFRPDQDEYYIESELIKLRRFAQSDKKLNFFDRSFYSIRAYNYGRKMIGWDNAMDSVDKYILGTKKPDFFVYLRISNIDLCNKRKERGVKETNVWTRPDSLDHIKKFYDNFFMKTDNQITIETDGKDLSEVREILITELKKYV